jgi:DNA-binding NtrC family response regulator
MSKNRPAILVVDDDQDTRDSLEDFLELQDYTAETADSMKAANTVLAERHINGVLLDLKLPDGNGLNMIQQLREQHPHMSIVVITGTDDVGVAVEAMHRGADHYLIKPVKTDELESILEKSLELERLKRDNLRRKRLDQDHETFRGQSDAAKKMWSLARNAADNDAVILLQGETGTGKGLVAKWIHDHSSFADEAFVAVNCSSLRGELLSSELFGHRKGAFTSAVEDREGLIEVADGGTLFLDEIGDMDLAIQAQFLKVIEEKRFRRVGDTEERRSEFRLICATNRDLAQAVEEETFRKDLYYRICVFPIDIPPLRDRLEDLPGLIDHFLKSMGLFDVSVDDEVQDLLQNYGFPGNIRELRNVLERARLLSGGADLTLEHFPGLTGAGAGAAEEPAPTDWSLETQEGVHIRRALEHFDGDVSVTAEALGISRPTLYRRIKKLGIPLERK